MKRLIFLLYIFVVALVVRAQDITGEIVDNEGYAVPFASVSYKGHHIAVSSDIQGRFTIERHNGWPLTISSVGFKQEVVDVNEETGRLKVVLKEQSKKLDEVVVKSKRGKYRRKENPAVALMRRVIAAKEQANLKNHDYYQYDKYQKLTLAFNDIKAEDLEGGLFKKTKWLSSQVEVSPYNEKLTLPVSLDETYTQQVWRKNPEAERSYIRGKKSVGLNNVLQTGEILNTVLKEVFMDVDIYDDYVKLLQYHFTSPIGDNAIYFYRYYIEDTVHVGRDRCYHLQFIPNNQQDFGFRGELYIVADSSLHVKRCNITLPKRTDVNWVDNMQIRQEYEQLDNGEWVLTVDDMIVEMSITEFMPKALVVRNTRMSKYSFDPLPDKLFSRKAPVIYDSDAMIRNEAYWQGLRPVSLTRSEARMGDFVREMEQSKGYKWIMVGIRALMENYVETSTSPEKNKFNVGPINTFLSYNFVDGLRLRVAGATTAHLNPHLFLEGFYAYGTKSNNHYYDAKLTYSLNRKENLPFEFPVRNFSFESSYDVMAPSDKFLLHNKDNAFMILRSGDVDKMYFYNLQKASFEYETEWGLGLSTYLKTESNEPTGDLVFEQMDGSLIGKIRTTEWNVGFKYAPGKNYINTKQHRFNVNKDAPEFNLGYTMGINRMLGGQYRYHLTDVGFYKRIWLGSFGFVNVRMNASAQWSKVPFPMLIFAPSNLSYFDHDNTFSMLRDMEFLTDRYAFCSLAWNLNGKLFNRIPLLRKLKWREYVNLRGMVGKLTNKNNPLLEENQNDPVLFQFPEATQVISSDKPYAELVLGVHNIFKFFGVDYVRRLSYTRLPGVKNDGIRFGFKMTF